jgi:type I restriction enzyme, S subunit
LSGLSDVELPKGWVRSTLRDILLTIEAGKSFTCEPRPAGPNEWGVIKVSAMTWGKFNERENKAVPAERAVNPAYEIHPGDILISRANTREYVGAPVLVGRCRPRLLLSDKSLRLVPTRHVSKKWLTYLLSSPKVRQYISETATGTKDSMRNISQQALLDIPLMLPPLAEQHRIVETLEDHLSRLDAACEALRRSLARAIHLRQSTIRRMLRGEGIPVSPGADAAEDFHAPMRLLQCDQPWSIPEGWVWTTIGSLFSVYIGATPSRKIPELWSGPIPWVSSGEVNFSRISDTRERISEAAVGNRETRLHPPGTVMIAMIGEGKTRGQAAILDIEATHNQNCSSIRVSETKVLPEYIYLVLEERYQQSRKASSGGNQPALNKAKVEAIPVPLPPLVTQQYIVATVDEFSRVSDRFRSELEKTLKMASVLRRALLADAFSGQLVPQAATDEPASSLLDRIRAEREAQGGKPSQTVRRPRKTVTAEVPPPPPASATSFPTNAVQQEFPL